MNTLVSREVRFFLLTKEQVLCSTPGTASLSGLTSSAQVCKVLCDNTKCYVLSTTTKVLL